MSLLQYYTELKPLPFPPALDLARAFDLALAAANEMERWTIEHTDK